MHSAENLATLLRVVGVVLAAASLGRMGGAVDAHAVPPPNEAALAVRVALPAELPARFRLLLVDREPEAFRITGDARLLPASVDVRDFAWDPLADEELEWGIQFERAAPGWVEGRFDWEGLPADRPLWLCATVWDGLRFVAPAGSVPLAIGILSEGRVADEIELRFSSALWGAVTGRVGAGGTREPSEVELGRAGSARERRTLERGFFLLGPVPAGTQRFDALVHGERGWYRRIQPLEVSAGRVADLGVWRPGQEPRRWIVGATDPDGDRLEGRFVLEFAEFPEWLAFVPDDRPLELWGEWDDLRAIRFEPDRGARFPTVRVEVRDVVGGRIELVSRPYDLDRIVAYARSVLLDGERAFDPLLAFTRDPSQSFRPSWRPTRLGFRVNDCVHWPSELLEPGPLEILAWSPLRGLSARQVQVLPASKDGTHTLELICADPRTVVRGRLVLTVAGLAVEDWLLAAPVPRGMNGAAIAAQLAAFERVLGPRDNPIRVAPGPFELRGIPTDLDWDLVLFDTTHVEVLRRPVRLAAGEVLDLGLLAVELP